MKRSKARKSCRKYYEISKFSIALCYLFVKRILKISRNVSGLFESTISYSLEISEDGTQKQCRMRRRKTRAQEKNHRKECKLFAKTTYQSVHRSTSMSVEWEEQAQIKNANCGTRNEFLSHQNSHSHKKKPTNTKMTHETRAQRKNCARLSRKRFDLDSWLQ